MKNRSMKVIAGIRRASRDSDHKRCPQPVQEVWLRSAGWKGNNQELELLMEGDSDMDSMLCKR